MPNSTWTFSARTLAGGSVEALTSLAIVLTLGLLAFAPLGADAGRFGITAALLSVVVGGALYALLGTSAAPTAGPSSATTLILASLLATAVADPAIDPSRPADLVLILALSGSAVLLAGLFQIAMTFAGAHRLARLVPQPVLAGFMNGVALLILVAQVPPLLGLPGGTALLDPVSQAAAQPLAAALGLATAAAVWASMRLLPRWPAAPIGLLAGCALYWACRSAWPQAPIGPLVGDAAAARWVPDLLGALATPVGLELLSRHLDNLLLTAVALAIVSTLESLLAAAAIDQITNQRHDPRRELIAIGAANAVTGLFGGLPVVLLRSRAVVQINRQASGRVAPLVAAVWFAALLALGAGLLSLLPKPVLAGIMVTIAVALVDRWTSQLLRQLRAGDRSRETLSSLALVTLVAGATFAFGFVVAIALGTLLSMAIFIRRLNRSLIRARLTAAESPSRRVYPPDQEAVLAGVRDRIRIFELEGALFFGTAERLVADAEQLEPQRRALVIDLRRLTMIDESGAVQLEMLSQRLAARGVQLLLAGIGADHPHGRRLRAFGCFRGDPRSDWFADTDLAVEAAERSLLADRGLAQTQARVELRDGVFLRGVSESQLQLVAGHLVEQRLSPGESLFRVGEPGDRLYLLSEGSISIVGERGHRFVSYSPGQVFGEAALLDGNGRSAAAVADAESVVQVLTDEALQSVCRQDPELGIRLMRNLATNLSHRLRVASTAWQASAS